jgi:hypothetical protein
METAREQLAYVVFGSGETFNDHRDDDYRHNEQQYITPRGELKSAALFTRRLRLCLCLRLRLRLEYGIMSVRHTRPSGCIGNNRYHAHRTANGSVRIVLFCINTIQRCITAHRIMLHFVACDSASVIADVLRLSARDRGCGMRRFRNCDRRSEFVLWQFHAHAIRSVRFIVRMCSDIAIGHATFAVGSGDVAPFG